jgi:hypothetical protein
MEKMGKSRSKRYNDQVKFNDKSEIGLSLGRLENASIVRKMQNKKKLFASEKRID